MKASVDRKALSNAIKLVRAAAPRTPGHPVLNGMHLLASGDVLRLTCTNLDLSISTTIDATGVETGAAIPALRLFSSLVDVGTCETIRLELDGDDFAVICGDTQATLRSYPVENWPKATVRPNENPVVLTADDMVSLGRVMHAVGHDAAEDARRLSVHFDGSTAETTNSFQLARVTLDTDTAAKVNVPGDVIAAVLRAAPEGCSFAHDGHLVTFNAGRTTWTSTLIATEWYSTDQLIPTNSPHRLTFDRVELAEALKRVALFNDGKTAPVVAMERDGDKVHLTARLIDVGVITDTLAVDGDFDDKIGVNPLFLGQALEAHYGEQVTLEFTELRKPIAIRSDGLIDVLMPVRLPA